MFMIDVLKYSSFCQLITHDLVMIKTLNFCRFCLFSQPQYKKNSYSGTIGDLVPEVQTLVD